ncbi:19348_t:CDS:1 [Dentiscutata erythropus]|uniref:19348_t:CDS:1 n=1 Tax=Dentiscutata erythropus TaxID=1348616 RepID=A0A9N9BRK4_9GLOM|nr:19348_t:CDS:1 [Dentiscutata erythropus]
MLVLALIFLVVWVITSNKYGVDEKGYLFTFGVFALISFHLPNFLQTLFIVLNWPINFYFIKLWVFILILSLTRTISYFDVKEVPTDILVTLTAATQWAIHELIARSSTQINEQDE